MSFLVSPGVNVNEIDLSNVIPAVSTSIGGYVGEFSWGPVGIPTLISSEKELVAKFGPPNVSNQESYLNAASFLKYGNALQVVRSIDTDVALNSAQLRAKQTSKNDEVYDNSDDSDVKAYIANKNAFDGLSLPTGVTRPDPDSAGSPDGDASGWDWAARYPGDIGNSLAVTYQVAGSNQEMPSPATDIFDTPSTSDWAANTISSSVNDEVHVVVFDQDGLFTGTKLTVLEAFSGLSMLSDAKKPDGSSNYFRDVINRESNYIYISNAEFFVNGIDRSGSYYVPGNASSDSVTYQSFEIDATVTGKTLDMESSITGTYPANDGLDDGVPVSMTGAYWWGDPEQHSISADQAEVVLKADDDQFYSFTGTALENGLSAGESFEIDSFPDDSIIISGKAYQIEYVNVNIAADSQTVVSSATSLSLSLSDFVPEGDSVSLTKNELNIPNSGDRYISYFEKIGESINSPSGYLADFIGGSPDGRMTAVSCTVTHNGGAALLDDLSSSLSLLNVAGFDFITLNFGTTLTATSGMNISFRFAKFHEIDLNDFSITLATDPISETLSLSGGSNGAQTAGDISTGLDTLADGETVDVNLLFAQAIGTDTIVPRKILEVCEARKDCVGFVSPPLTSTSLTGKNTAGSVEKFFANDLNINSNYVVFDSTPVYVYNKYNDTFRFIQAAGHVAGLCARTDDTNDPWFSPAGYNRGQLLSIAKLKFNPNQAQRDELYKSRINPIVSFPGQGTLLFGDKTGQAKASAFDRINVRRLFIVLEKAISTASKYQLFELNDEFTRAMFRNMTEPFLRDVKGRRGIYDFLVVCDETNNTPEVIDSNRFVADIYIKPAKSINYITLNFIATRTGVEFSEIAGASNNN